MQNQVRKKQELSKSRKGGREGIVERVFESELGVAWAAKTVLAPQENHAETSK